MKTKLTEKTWPKNLVKSIETRKRDLVIRVANWTRQSLKSGEPGYDVEVYANGVYDWNESKCFTLHSGLTKQQAKKEAIEFAKMQIEKHLR